MKITTNQNFCFDISTYLHNYTLGYVGWGYLGRGIGLDSIFFYKMGYVGWGYLSKGIGLDSIFFTR